MRLSDKIQLLLDAILGFVNIQQNDLFKILTIVSRRRRAADHPGRHLGHEFQEHAGVQLDLRLSAGLARRHRQRSAATAVVQAAGMV